MVLYKQNKEEINVQMMYISSPDLNVNILPLAKWDDKKKKNYVSKR